MLPYPSYRCTECSLMRCYEEGIACEECSANSDAGEYMMFGDNVRRRVRYHQGVAQVQTTNGDWWDYDYFRRRLEEKLFKRRGIVE